MILSEADNQYCHLSLSKMRITLLCASLEPGKDGVGDYVRKLALALCAIGVDVMCVALNDRFVNSASTEEIETRYESDKTIRIWRFPTAFSWNTRLRLLQKQLDCFQPDWLSLQFVPYGFHKKGIPWGLPAKLNSLEGNFRWHIMFHELWIGGSERDLWKQKVIGYLQMRVITKLGALAALTHTSNGNYSDQLKGLGLESWILPVFSNISVDEGPALINRDQLIKEVFNTAIKSEDCWIFAFFGTLHQEWYVETFLERIRRAGKKARKSAFLFISMGHIGTAGEVVWDKMSRTNVWEGFRFLRLGRLSEQDISQYLKISDFGIATSPYVLLGKSGSAAAMREHGLPLIVTRLLGAKRNTASPDDGIVFFDSSFESSLGEIRIPVPKSDGATEVASNLLKALTKK